MVEWVDSIYGGGEGYEQWSTSKALHGFCLRGFW